MAKMLTIIGCAGLFALLGLLSGYVAVAHLPERENGYSFFVILLSVLPPLLGSVLGLVVGCVALFIANKVGTKQ